MLMLSTDTWCNIYSTALALCSWQRSRRVARLVVRPASYASAARSLQTSPSRTRRLDRLRLRLGQRRLNLRWWLAVNLRAAVAASARKILSLPSNPKTFKFDEKTHIFLKKLAARLLWLGAPLPRGPAVRRCPTKITFSFI